MSLLGFGGFERCDGLRDIVVEDREVSLLETSDGGAGPGSDDDIQINSVAGMGAGVDLLRVGEEVGRGQEER